MGTFQQIVADQIASINQIPLKMAVTVKIDVFEDDFLEVNGKTVIKDMDGSWKCSAELTTFENRCLKNFLGALNTISGKILTATYKI